LDLNNSRKDDIRICKKLPTPLEDWQTNRKVKPTLQIWENTQGKGGRMDDYHMDSWLLGM